MPKHILLLLICLAGLHTDVLLAQGTVLIPAGAVWKYQDNGEDLGTNWTAVRYEDTSWPSGPAPLGFGATNNATVLSYGPDPDWKYVTYYFRYTFDLDDPSAYNHLYLRLLRDDGVVVYLNGQELHRDNMPEGAIDYLTLAVTNVHGDEESTYDLTSYSASLRAGINVLAVELHQAAMDSIDLNFDLQLSAGSIATVTRGPYLQMRGCSNIVIRWRTEEATDSSVLCGTNLGNLNLSFSDSKITTEHEVGLTNLQAQTTYYYAIASATTSPLSRPDMFFSTAPPNRHELPGPNLVCERLRVPDRGGTCRARFLLQLHRGFTPGRCVVDRRRQRSIHRQ